MVGFFCWFDIFFVGILWFLFWFGFFCGVFVCLLVFCNGNIFPQISVVKKSKCGIFTYNLSFDPDEVNYVNIGNVDGVDDLSVTCFI